MIKYSLRVKYEINEVINIFIGKGYGICYLNIGCSFV